MNERLYVKIYCKGEMPRKANPHDAGFDVCANDNYIVQPKEVVVVHTGIYMEIPEGYECQVRSRSGLATKHKLFVVNQPGTIDSTYRGECNVALINLGDAPFSIRKGDRIAQFVFKKVEDVEFLAVQHVLELSKTERGDGGFGSTGVETLNRNGAEVQS